MDVKQMFSQSHLLTNKEKYHFISCWRCKQEKKISSRASKDTFLSLWPQ